MGPCSWLPLLLDFCESLSHEEWGLSITSARPGREALGTGWRGPAVPEVAEVSCRWLEARMAWSLEQGFSPRGLGAVSAGEGARQEPGAVAAGMCRGCWDEVARQWN